MVYQFPVDVDDAQDSRLRALVRDKIRRRIVDGRVPPGARLVERNLAAELGVSRVPVREALRDLVAEGYPVNRATRGIAVRRYPEPEIDELFEIRRALEALVVRRAVDGLPGDALARLEGTIELARSALDAGDPDGAVLANGEFREVLTEVAAGPLLREILLGIRDLMRWLLRQHTEPEVIPAEHEALPAAIAAGDREEAERRYAHHLRTSRSAVGKMSPDRVGQAG